MLSWRALRAVKSAIGFQLCASLVGAQQTPSAAPGSSPPEAVFSVTTTLVQVDAVVTDSKGRYATDLTADDFAVYEDGKPRKIANFSYVRNGTQAPIGPKAAAGKPAGKSAPALPPAPAAPLRPQDVRRTIVLMVDDLGLSFESIRSVRAALRKFVERQMQPGDLVAVCRTGAGSGALQQFTTNQSILLHVIDDLRWNANGRAGLSFLQPFGKAAQLAEQKAEMDMGARNGDYDAAEASYSAERNTILAVGALGAIDYIVRALRDMPGRKSIVLFSDGLHLFTPGQGPVRHAGAKHGPDMQSDSEIREALRKLVDRANRAGTVIYTIHTGGLQTLQPGAQDRVEPAGTNGLQAQPGVNPATQVGVAEGRDFGFAAGQQGLAQLALETGGIAYENGNDLNYGLDRVLEDQQGYYVLGFKPAAGTFDDKHGSRGYHQVKVEVTRPGLRTRSRSGFFGETDDETLPKYSTPLEQMRAAMLSPFHSSDVRLRLTALYAEVPKRGPVVRNLLHIDARDLTFQSADGLSLVGRAGGAPSSEVEILAVATSLGDLPVAAEARFYKVHAPANRFDAALNEGALYTLEVPVKKRGAYQIQVAVRDVATGKMGSASQFLEIPELKRGRLALTSIVLRNGDGRGGMSPVTRQFEPGSEVEYSCLVENAGKTALAANVESQIRIVRDGQEVYAAPVKLVPMDGGGLALSGKLKLGAAMTPGDYYLGIVARDRAAPKGGMAAQWTDFEIMP